MKNGWDIIRERNERKAKAEASRKPAPSQDEKTGSVRMAEATFRHTASFLELVLDAPEAE